MSSQGLSNELLVELGANLLRVTNVNDYFNVVASLIPMVCQADYYNMIIANPKANLYLRHFSPKFPIQIFTDYARRTARSDFMLQVGFQKNAGDTVHLASLAGHPNQPTEWKEIVESARISAGIIDSLAVVLYVDQDRQWGAALTMYRVQPNTAFSSETADILGNLGPLLATGFENAWNQAVLSLSHETLTRIFFGFGNLSLLVSNNATPVQLDEQTALALRTIYNVPSTTHELPSALKSLLEELIWLLTKNEHVTLASKETSSPAGPLRVYVTANPGLTGKNDVFSVVIMCDPGFANLQTLSSVGFTKREIEVLEFLQRGSNNREIARLMTVSENTVKFHMRNISEKLQASGKSEILARAISMSHEIAITNGMAVKPSTR